MKITFVSNYINHHQIPFCDALAKQEGTEFSFVQTEPMEQERVDMGWGASLTELPYVCLAYEQREECMRLVTESDVVIWGGVSDESMLKPRLKAGKIVFRYDERLYKTGLWRAVSPKGLWKKYHDHTKYRKDQVYMLCAGAYVALDFSIIWAYPNKKLCWGYFPATKQYDINALMTEKRQKAVCENGKKEILWAARFIDWKHPEVVVQLAELLKNKRNDFYITMIGGGEMEPEIQKMVKEKGLEDHVRLVGYKTPAQVRTYMEKAHIYLVTSNRLEGWGAVLNEAMNSGCAVVSSHMIGAAPYLIRQDENGFMYRDGDVKDLLRVVDTLLENDVQREYVGKAAYETIVALWNAEVAARRFVQIAEDALEKGAIHHQWTSGPGSLAPILKESRRIPYLHGKRSRDGKDRYTD